MVSVEEGECLLERKQVLGAVAAGERLLDRLSTGVAPVIAQVRKRVVENLHRRAKAFGFVLHPAEPTPSVAVS